MEVGTHVWLRYYYSGCFIDTNLNQQMQYVLIVIVNVSGCLDTVWVCVCDKAIVDAVPHILTLSGRN
jgi:hypothetical protein